MRIEGQIRSIVTGAIRDAQAQPVRDYHGRLGTSWGQPLV
jgi:hypothetical protein